MKSLKSLFAFFAIAALSFGCASVTDASLNEQLSNDQAIEAPAPDNGVFSGGVGVEPIVEKPW
jgi:hypothetical protein